MFFYSNSTSGFYTTAIHGTDIPADCVEITAQEYRQLLDGAFNGKIIGINPDTGKPILVDVHPLVTSAVAATWERIKAERDRRILTGGYRVGDNWFHSDMLSRTQQIGLVMMGGSIPAGLQWKTMAGTFVAMTPQLAGQIFAAAAVSDQAIFAVAEGHRLTLESCPDVEAYDFSGGWPPMFGE